MQLSSEMLEKLAQDQWVYTDSFFTEDELKELKNIALKRWEKGQFQPAKVGRSAEQQAAPQIRSDWISWIDLNDPEVAFFTSHIQQLQTDLNQSLFLGLQNFECHFARYSQGQFYDEHIDQPRLKSFLHGERLISCVLYLNESWKPGDGGELSIRMGEQKNLAEPRWGRVVLFRSDTVPHAVLPAIHERWSLTGWFRRS